MAHIFSGKAGRTLSARDHWIMYRSAPEGEKSLLMMVHVRLWQHIQVYYLKESKKLKVHLCKVVSLMFFLFKGHLIARGITNYSSDELKLIKDHQ